MVWLLVEIGKDVLCEKDDDLDIRVRIDEDDFETGLWFNPKPFDGV